MSGVLIDYDPVFGIEEVFHWDPVNESFTIETKMDGEYAGELNKYFRDNNIHMKGDVRLAASIPLHIWMDPKNAHIRHDPEALRKWLNDPENRPWRTSTARV